MSSHALHQHYWPVQPELRPTLYLGTRSDILTNDTTRKVFSRNEFELKQIAFGYDLLYIYQISSSTLCRTRKTQLHEQSFHFMFLK